MNLAANPAYAKKLAELRKKHQEWTKQYGDLGAINEVELVKKWWNGQSAPPVTEKAVIGLSNGTVSITCPTKGASIGFRTKAKGPWQVYTKPFVMKSGDSLFVMSHRIGYVPSESRIKINYQKASD